MLLSGVKFKLLTFSLCAIAWCPSTYAGNADSCVAVVQEGNQFIFVNKCSVRVKIIVEFGYVGKVNLNGITATYPIDLEPNQKAPTGLTIYQFYLIKYEGVYL